MLYPVLLLLDTMKNQTTLEKLSANTINTPVSNAKKDGIDYIN